MVAVRGDIDELARSLVNACPRLDPAAVAAARARVAAALFGGRRTALGRFRLLERLGAGGMGIVYAAHDPDLDRCIALKVVRVAAGGRDAALTEAKALARLAHPNVVPVHDAGVIGDRVYIVMELVRGATLRRWAPGRGRREILRMYRQAGAALAAAHAAGLVHRDFKPDNAIVGSDGRVRVVDFGLACEASDGEPSGRPVIAGTPRYMAPEQAAGAPATPAADQYGFCVALGEALAAIGPVPRWLAAALARGRDADPAARFPSMRDLLGALARDRTRSIGWRAAAVALVAVAAGAYLAGRASPDDPCRGGAEALAAAWPPAARDAALARIGGLGPYGAALAPRLDAQLRGHAARWTAGRRDACLAHRRGAQSPALHDRRLACLERGRAALSEVADVLGSVTASGAASGLPAAAIATASLPDPAACSDLDALLATPEPPPPAIARRAAQVGAAIERARIQLAAGATNRAHATAASAVASARALGHRPLVAEALLAQGRAGHGDPARAAAALGEASAIALEVGDDALAVEAWSRRVEADVARGVAPATALASRDVFEAIAARAPSARHARALLHGTIGAVERARGDRAAARAAFERALTDAGTATGGDALARVAVRTRLAQVTDDPGRRDALLADAEHELARVLGDAHPRTLEVRALRTR